MLNLSKYVSEGYYRRGRSYSNKLSYSDLIATLAMYDPKHRLDAIEGTFKTFAFCCHMGDKEDLNPETYAKFFIGACEIKKEEDQNKVKDTVKDNWKSIEPKVKHWMDYYENNDVMD